jgi:plastocyanin
MTTMGSIISERRCISLALCLGLLGGCDSRPIGAPADGIAASAPASAVPAGAVQARIRATDAGFEPAEVRLKQGKPGFLVFTRESDRECVNAVRMPWMTEAQDLPKDQPVSIRVDTSQAGTFSYACWMNMVFGRVVIDPS